jgi:ATP-dependent DNA helicase RecG
MASSLLPTDEITQVSGIGPASADHLQNLDIHTVQDLLDHYPSRYINFGTPQSLDHIPTDSYASFVGYIQDIKTAYTKTRKLMTTARLTSSPQARAPYLNLIWFNSPYIKTSISTDKLYVVAGKVVDFIHKPTIISPTLEVHDRDQIHTSDMTPIYPLTAGVTARWLRSKIYHTLRKTKITDSVSPETRTRLDLVPLDQAYQHIHFPESLKSQTKADLRLSYQALYHINSEIIRSRILGKQAIAIKTSQKDKQDTNSSFSYTLTRSQIKSIDKSIKLLGQGSPQQILLQGETGSGKTAVIMALCLHYYRQGYSSLVLAPTQILAEQHHISFSSHPDLRHHTRLYTSQTTDKTLSHTPTIYIGTHSLVNMFDTQSTPPIALVCIDEQHKFGTQHKDHFLALDPTPHTIHISATPIPRTVALGLLGDTEIVKLRNDRADRQPIKTFVIDSFKFQSSWTWLNSQLSESQKVLVVAPRIEDKDEDDHKSVLRLHKLYTNQIKDSPVFLLHGRQSKSEQATNLANFRTSKSGVLVATTIVEVGVDIPSLNIIMIHRADQYGLAQLHQLRGRVGRHGQPGYCFLVHDQETESSRLSLLQKYHTGEALAKADLKLRGAGEVLGVRQHGMIRTRLKHFWSKKVFQMAKKQALSDILEHSNKDLLK